MAVNRLGHLLAPPASQTHQNSSVPVGFTLCPVFFVQLPAAQFAALQELYRQAYEAAQAKARVNRLEKRFFSCWN